jgi:hypothetical protein
VSEETAAVSVEQAAESADLGAAAPKKFPRIIHISPPIAVRRLAAELGLQPHRLIAELMSHNVFANISQTIDPHIAAKICENHGFILKEELREKGAAYYKTEYPKITPSVPTTKEEPTVTSLEVIHGLDTVTIRFLDTADKLAASLRKYDLDWSPAVIMLCKAFEKETNVRLLEPFRRKACGRDLKADISDEDLRRVARFCSGSGQPPELGTLGHFLNTAIHSKQRRTSSILFQSFYELVSAWPRSQWLVDELGLTAALKKLTKEFRNRAAHIETLNESEFGNCRNFVRNAPEMVLLRLFLATGC